MAIKIISDLEVERLINVYHEWAEENYDFDDIDNAVDFVKTFFEIKRDGCPDPDMIELSVNNIRLYYGINRLSELEDKFEAAFDDDNEMDEKIETVDNCIRLMLMDDVTFVEGYENY